MPRLLPHEIYLLALRGETQLGGRPLPSKKEAQEWLTQQSGQDFGFNVAAWERWIRDNPKVIHSKSSRPNRYTTLIADLAASENNQMDLNTFQQELSKLLMESELTAESLRVTLQSTRDGVYADAMKFGLNIGDPFFDCVGLGQMSLAVFFETEFTIYAVDCDEKTLIAATEELAMVETEACKEMLKVRFNKSQPDLRIPRALAELWMS